MGEISKNVQERGLELYRHVMIRDEEYVGERVMRMDVDGGGEGKEEQRWMDSVNVGLRQKGLSGRRRKTGLCGSNCSEKSTPHRSGKRCDERRRSVIGQV